MDKTFTQLGVAEPIVKAIEEMGFATPTKVQAESIPKILDRKDLIVMSKTGSGKTGAFGIPILQAIVPDGNGPKALILAPARELAVQVDADIKAMSKYMDLKTTALYGQHNMATEIKALKDGAAIVAGTPGRVYDHIKRKTFNTKNIEFIVLDEADRMLDMGFIDQVIQIIKSLPRKRTTLLFSATMPPEIQRICKAYMQEPITIELDTDTMTVDSIKQIYYRVNRNEKRSQLEKVLKHEQPESCMIFCNTRVEVDRVQEFLNRKGYHAESLHGANNQNQRMNTINKFKKNDIQIMVATDVAARGIHIDDLSMVINYDIPEDRNSYVHRIGRTGRAGNSGLAISLITADDIMSLYEIEEHVGCLIEEVPFPSDEAIAEAVVAGADSKWAKMAPPKVQQPKKRDQSHKGKKPYNNSKPSNYKKTESVKTQKPVKTQKVAQTQKAAQTPKVGQTSKAPQTQKAVQTPKPSQSSKLAQSKKPVQSKKPEQTPNAKQKHSEPKQAIVQKEAKKYDNKTKSYTKQTPKKTKMVMTKMGPIEMIINEPEKKSFANKIKGIFGK